MRSRRSRNFQATISDFRQLLSQLYFLVDIVLVEGRNDAIALRQLGYCGRIEVLSRVGVSDSDIIDEFENVNSILILTDFDEEGRRIYGRFYRFLTRKKIKVEEGLRQKIGKLLAELGIYSIEALSSKLN